MRKSRCLAIASVLGLASIFGFSNAVNPAQPPLFAVLLGGNEVDTQGKANAGDPDGIGSANVLFAGSKLCFGITVTGIERATLAHIHKGDAGINGGIAVNLIPPNAAGHSSGCVPVGRKLAKDIQTNPQGFYVNIHNEQFPSGALRGQLF